MINGPSSFKYAEKRQESFLRALQDVLNCVCRRNSHEEIKSILLETELVIRESAC